MKKFVLIALALMLALPAVSFAGSATSRWDVTIGGFVKADFGWSDTGNGADYAYAPRDASPYASNENKRSKYSSIYMAAGETRLNLAIKGPDGWGAKTSAFIEGEFTGATGAANAYNLFRLRHAFINFNWGKASLLMGQTWDNWGVIFPDLLGRSEDVPMRRGWRAPQIRFTYNFTPNWQAYFGVYQPNTNAQGSWNATASDADRSNVPALFGEFTYMTDKCGVIGPDKLLLAVGGTWGQEKVTYVNPVVPGTFSSENGVNMWAASFKGYIPIIPAKKGNKQFAMFLKGQFAYGQNYRTFVGSPTFVYDGAVDPAVVDFVAPTAFGGYAQLGFYFTDRVWANLYYGFVQNNISNTAQWYNPTTPVNAIKNHQQWSINVLYDVNPAVRLGLQYTYMATGYARYGTDTEACNPAAANLAKSGTLNSIRAAAWYFF